MQFNPDYNSFGDESDSFDDITEDEDADDDSNEQKQPYLISKRIKVKEIDFESIADRESRKILFLTLHLSYHHMHRLQNMNFKNILQPIYNLLQMNDKKEKSKFHSSMWMILQTYFQEHYSVFINHGYHKMCEQKSMVVKTIDDIIENVYKTVCEIFPNYMCLIGNNFHRIQFEMKKYIAKCCVLSCKMLLNRPLLYFYPRLFSNDMKDEQIFRTFIYHKSVDEINSIYVPFAMNGNKTREEKENMDMHDVKKDNFVLYENEPFQCLFMDENFYSLLNLDEFDDDVDDDCMVNSKSIAYCGWPSLIRSPLLDTEQHSSVTKAHVYCHPNPETFLNKTLVEFYSQAVE